MVWGRGPGTAGGGGGVVYTGGGEGGGEGGAEGEGWWGNVRGPYKIMIQGNAQRKSFGARGSRN